MSGASLEEKSERAAPGGSVVAFPGLSRGPCPICGHPLQGRQKSACSARCRAEKSRRGQAALQADRTGRLRTLAQEILRELGGENTS